MTTDLDVRQPSAALAIRPGQEFWTREQRAALSVLGIRGASNADLAIFMHYCQKTGLDPFSRQIYGIMRREKIGDEWVDKFTIQVGIDGFRVIRDRIAARLGVTVEYEDSRWYDEDGIAYEVWLRDEPPLACGMAVLKDGKRFPAVVRYSAFVQMRNGKPTSMWQRMDAEQLEKCAEAKALRRAFPHDLGGIYLEDEMPPPPADVPRRPVRVTAEEITGNGAHPAAREREPENPTGAAPAAATAPTAAPAPARTARPAKPSAAATERLQHLLRQIPLGEDEDVALLLAAWTGKPGISLDADLTAADVKVVTTTLEDALREAGDNPELAASQIWETRNARKKAAGDG